jgi:hypothetical protein
MRTCRGEEGGLVESATTMTVEPWREGQQGRSWTLSGEIGKEEERRGMTGKRVTLMNGETGAINSDWNKGNEDWTGGANGLRWL